MVSPGLDNIQQSSFTYNFDYERRIEAEDSAAASQESASGDDQSGSSNQAAASVQVRKLCRLDGLWRWTLGMYTEQFKLVVSLVVHICCSLL